MKRILSFRLLLFILILFVLVVGVFCFTGILSNCKICFLFQSCEINLAGKPSGSEKIVTVDKIKILAKIHAKARELKSYVASRKMNTRIGFLVNMRQHSGQKRFYSYGLK